MSQQFDTAAIIGVGLLGGSLGLALKSRGLAHHVYGVGRRISSLETAVSVGAIDKPFLEPKDAVKDADLIVICTPASLVAAKLDEIRDMCRHDAVVTDVASTKTLICRHAESTWAKPLRFIGSHPMAGSEKFGPEHASPTLYQDSVTMVALQNNTDSNVLGKVKQLWESVGSRVIEIEPELHDAIVARTSHLPHITASAIAQVAAEQKNAILFVGNGFRDHTRIAAGRAELWRDICLTNQEAVGASLDTLIGRLQEIKNFIEQGNATKLESFFEAGQNARRRILGE